MVVPVEGYWAETQSAPLQVCQLSRSSESTHFRSSVEERVMTFGNRKRRNPWFVWTRKNLGLLFHALVAVHHTVVGGHHSSVDSRS